MKNTRSVQMLFLAGIAVMLLIPASSLAQGKLDFSGKWVLNEGKSQLGETRGFSAAELSVKQDGAAISLDRIRANRDGEMRTRSETLTADGKEHKDEGENRTTTSVATWSNDGKSLTIKYDIEFERQGETFTMKRTEVWTLDKSGKILTIQSDSSSQRGDSSVTLVYDKG